MSAVSVESVLAVAEQLGIDAEGVAPMVAAQVEFRMRRLLQDMIRFMSFAKRQKLSTSDTLHALRLCGLDGVYGFGCSDAMSFMKGTINGDDIYFLKEREIDLTQLAATEDLPKVPAKPIFSIHWLSINGVQPTTVENPRNTKPAKNRPDTNKAAANKRQRSTGDVAMKPVVKHILSQEFQLYYDNVIQAIKSSVLNPGASQNVYSSLATDPGLHQLIPYFSKFISETVMKNLRNFPLLTSVLRLARCLLINPDVKLELYLHQLMPAIMTCLVGKRLCQSPFEDHWSLRRLAASLVHLVCTKYGDSYAELQPRISKTLHQALLDKKKPLTTQYGAIVGITVLGPLSVEKVLLPVMASSVKKMNEVLASKKTGPLKRLETRQCFAALQDAAGSYLHFTKGSISSKETNQHLADACEEFGEVIHPYFETTRSESVSAYSAADYFI